MPHGFTPVGHPKTLKMTTTYPSYYDVMLKSPTSLYFQSQPSISICHSEERERVLEVLGFEMISFVFPLLRNFGSSKGISIFKELQDSDPQSFEMTNHSEIQVKFSARYFNFSFFSFPIVNQDLSHPPLYQG